MDMKWQFLSTILGLAQDKETELRNILVELQQRFLELCHRPVDGADASPLARHAQFVAVTNPDPGTMSAHLLHLLQQHEPGGPSRTEEFLNIEHATRSMIEAQMTSTQAQAFKRVAPDSLLEIDIGFNPFVDALNERVGKLRPPSGFLCRSPFEYAHIQANGDVYPCCPSKFGGVIGNLTRRTLEEIWNSPSAREVRASIVDGSYRFCNPDACEYLRDALARKQVPSPPNLVVWGRDKGLLEPGKTPKVVNLGSDLTCNLSCATCRRKPFHLTRESRERILTIDANVFESLSDDTRRIVLLGEGDPFASPIYREKLSKYNWSRHPNLRLKIQTNGLLLTPAMWDGIRFSHPVIDWITISIDAATAATYKVNRSPDFQRLQRNLDFVANLRALQRIRRFSISFLVQANNYKEMPAFAQMGKRLCCDMIEFQRLENWATFSEEEYNERAVHEAFHPQHGEFLSVLEDPALQDDSVWELKLGPHPTDAAPVGIMSWDDIHDAA